MTDHSTQDRTNGRRRRGLRPEDGAVLGALMVGLLLWARLLLITDHPRMAIADPEGPRAVQGGVLGTVAGAGADPSVGAPSIGAGVDDPSVVPGPSGPDALIR